MKFFKFLQFYTVFRAILTLMLAVLMFSPNLALAVKTDAVNGVLVKGSGPRVYMVFNNVRRWIQNEKIFKELGYSFENVQTMPDDIVDSFAEGELVDDAKFYPDGSLLKDEKNRIYLIENGLRRWIANDSVFKDLKFNHNSVIPISNNQLQNIPIGRALRSVVTSAPPISTFTTINEPVQFPDTTILSADDTNIDTLVIHYTGNNPSSPKDALTYSTFIPSVDKQWSNFTTSTQRTISFSQYNLARHSGETLTFFVKAKNKKEIIDPTPASYNFKINISPWYKTIKILSVTLNESNPQKEIVILRNESNSSVNINGWNLVGRHNYKVTMSKVTLIPFVTNDNNVDLNLNSKDQLNIITGANILTNSSGGFRVNRCMGYFNALKLKSKFNEECYLPNANELNFLEPICQKYIIQQVSRCEVPNLQKEKDSNTIRAIQRDAQCTDYLSKHFNYDGCVKDYQSAKDFYKNTWFMYLNLKRDIWDNLSETLILTDREGMIVDKLNIKNF